MIQIVLDGIANTLLTAISTSLILRYNHRKFLSFTEFRLLTDLITGLSFNIFSIILYLLSVHMNI